MVDFTPCSIIIPVLNEQNTLAKQLKSLQPFRESGHEVIVVDGGSHDASIEIAKQYADRLIHSNKGRATQMNAGAAKAEHDWFLFLHVDTQLSGTSMKSLQKVFDSPIAQWGRFDVQIAGQHFLYKIISWFMNKRSRLTGISTGDQALFVKRSSFELVDGFPNIALMEDIALSQRLKKKSMPVCLTDTVTTSSRRWQNNGILRTIFLMWSLRCQYFFGASPVNLAERYNRVSK